MNMQGAQPRNDAKRSSVLPALVALLLGVGLALVMGIGGVFLGIYWAQQQPSPIAQNPPPKEQPSPPVNPRDDTPALPPADIGTVKTGDGPIVTPAALPVEKPFEKPVEKPFEKPVEKVVEKPKGLIEFPVVPFTPEQMEQAPALTLNFGVPSPRIEEMFFTSRGAQTKCALLCSRENPADLTQKLYIFPINAKQAVATPVPVPTFAPCRRSLGPDAKFFAMETRTDNAIGISIWEIGKAKPVVKDWNLPKNDDANPGGAYRGFTVVDGGQLLTVTAAGTLEWWQIPEMQSVKRLTTRRPLAKATPLFSADRRRCVLFDKDRFQVIDLDKREWVCETPALEPLPERPNVTCAAMSLSADGTKLAALMVNANPNPLIYCYNTATGKQVGPVASLPPTGKTPPRFSLGWFGPRHYFLLDRGGGMPASLYRVGDDRPSTTISFTVKRTLIGIGAHDDRLWYLPSDPADMATSLIGLRMPPHVEAATPDNPAKLVLTAKGYTK